MRRSIRPFIIESFIKLTKHFTKGAYDELVAQQKETETSVNQDQYDSNKDLNNGIKALSKVNANLISFDKFNYSLIFFHEGDGQGFSIVSNLPSIINSTNNSGTRDEYNKLKKLLNYQTYKDKDKNKRNFQELPLPDYKSYNQIQFLEELKIIFGLRNPVTNEELNKNIEFQKQMVEFIKKYNNFNDEQREEKILKTEEDLKAALEKCNKEIQSTSDSTEKKRKNYEKEILDTKKEKLGKIKPLNETNYRKYLEGEEERIEEIKKNKTLEEIVGKYVFTADNFIKMILILLRIRANIPVIMMGETGCGKTSLIKMLSRLLNGGEDSNMKILNINAGTSDKDIIDFIKNELIDDAYNIDEENKVKEIEMLSQGKIFIPKKIWVFLDEINTCKSMGLISELMCKHSYQGIDLPKCIVFIAACNPYRNYEAGKKINVGLDINQAHKEKKHLNQKEIKKLENSNNNLVYTVNPLPHSLLNYVFDFGNLEPNDEKKYIQSIVEKPIKNYESNLTKEQFTKIHSFATQLVYKAQNFIRNHNEISSVSLREIRRFNIFYEFFLKHLKTRKETDKFYHEFDYFTLQLYSVILGVFMCYYLRIVEYEIRQEFREMMNKEIKKFNFNLKEFLNIPIIEENYISYFIFFYLLSNCYPKNFFSNFLIIIKI